MGTDPALRQIDGEDEERQRTLLHKPEIVQITPRTGCDRGGARGCPNDSFMHDLMGASQTLTVVNQSLVHR